MFKNIKHSDIIIKVLEEAKKYDESHGSPHDRGRADAYYGRRHKPHKIIHTSGQPSKTVHKSDLKDHEVKAYSAGYQSAIDDDDFKDWN